MPDKARAIEDLVAAEVRKQTSPIMLTILVALVFALGFVVWGLWNDTQVQEAYIQKLLTKVQSLEDQSAFGDEVEKQRDLIEAIAEKLGVEGHERDDNP